MERQIIFSLSLSEFQDIIHNAVKEALQTNPGRHTSLQGADEYLDIAELAEMLSCSLSTIHRYKKLGMPFYRVERKVMFSKNRVLRFMERNVKKGG